MAATKTVTSIWSATSQAAAATTTSSAVSLTAGYGAVVHVKITNGGTGPTIAGQVQVQCSNDNSNYYDFGGPLIADTTASTSYSWVVEIPAPVKYVKLVGSGNTAQAVTLNADVSELTAI